MASKKKENRLTKKFVMITGASSGVGLSSVLLFSVIGYEVLACVQNEGEKRVLEKYVRHPVHILITELRDQDTISAAAEKTAGIVGNQGLACLVNVNFKGAKQRFAHLAWSIS